MNNYSNLKASFCKMVTGKHATMTTINYHNDCKQKHKHRPVLVELDGKVSHVLQGFIGEGHVHVHVTLTPREGSRYLQSFCFDCWQPFLHKPKK